MSSTPAKTARDRLILALDVDTLAQARQLVTELRDFVAVFKVGLQLFCSEGPRVFEELHKAGAAIFFDGKFLDIPNTVGQASAVACSHGVFMFNVHATGGCKMMQAAAQAARDTAAASGKEKPRVIAVTVLTSIGASTLKGELNVAATLEDQVAGLALLAKNAGLDGVVASAAEVTRLRSVCGPEFLLVTPGVRPAWSASDDQVRIVTPSAAMRDGADYIVVGRPITAAADKRDAARRILEEMDEALSAMPPHMVT